jgi:FKBP-type peptidyl-prolyl cis-trans isomerase SlyD
MKIDQNTVVSLTYTLTNETTGQQVEQTTNENPLVFLFGVGGLMPAFEDQLLGKTVGNTFDFSIKADEAYGQYEEGHIVNIPVGVFHDESGQMDTDTIKVGGSVPMVDNEGNHMRGTVREVNEEHVRMDFNHPMAGQDLHFKGEITDVREATKDELDHGHVHGEHGHQH